MIVEALSHQLQGQRILDATGFLQFGAFILEPDLDLGLVQSQLGAQLLATLFRQVTILIKFMLSIHMRRIESEKRNAKCEMRKDVANNGCQI